MKARQTSVSTFIRRIIRTGVFWALLGPLMRTAGFLLVISFALRILSPAEMGLWYVLVNISLLGGAIEMGFSSTIGRFSSYFMAGQDEVHQIGRGVHAPAGSLPNYPKLAGLVASARPLYFKFGLVTAVNILVFGGLWLWFSDPPKLQTRLQLIAFIVMGAGTAVNMTGLFWHHLLLGVNRVREYHVLTLLGLIAGYGTTLIGFLAGGGLLAMVVGFTLMSFLPRFQARRMMLAMIPPVEPQLVPVRDLWPMTWRTGTASFSNYLTIPFTTVIAAQISGLEAAGSYGLCMQIGLLLHLFSGSWLSVKAPLIAQLQSRRQFAAIRSICRTRMMLGMSTYLLGSICALLLAPALLELVGSRTTLLPTGQLALLLGIIGLDFMVGMHTLVIQTANHLPYLPAFVASAILTLPLAWLLGSQWGIWGIIAAPALVQVAWNYWWTPSLLWRYLNQPEKTDSPQDEQAPSS